MEIFIDADGCPVVDLTVNTAAEYNVEVTVICDMAHIFNRTNVKVITVEKGADSVDFELVNRIHKGDIAVTQDYGLAAMCLAKQAFPINQNGLVYNSGNIEGLLNARAAAQRIRRGGGRLKGPKKRTSQQDADFSAALKKLIADNI